MSRDWALFRVCMILYGISVVSLIVASIFLKTNDLAVSGIFGLVGGLFFIAGSIVGKKHDKVSQAKIDGLSQMMENLEHVPTTEDKYPWLDRNKLDRWTSEFKALEFSNLGDYTLGTGGVSVESFKLQEPFSRLMANEAYKCFADVTQSLRSKTGLSDMTCSIVTIFTSGRGCSTSNSKESKIVPGFLLPVNLVHHPGASPSELLRFHLEERDKLVKEGETIAEDMSFEAYQRYMSGIVKQIQDMVYNRVNRLM